MNYVVRIYEKKNEKAELINTFIYDMKTTGFYIINSLCDLQSRMDVFKMGNPCDISDLGIKRLFERGKVITTMSKDEDIWQNPCDYNGHYYGFEVYPVGYVLRTGRIAVNMFGTRGNEYISSWSRKRMRTGFKSAAKIFPSISKMKNWIEKNREGLVYLHSNNDMNFSVESVDDRFKEDIDVLYSDVKKKNHMSNLQEVEDMLNQINDSKVAEKKQPPVPQKATQKNMMEEALYRLKNFSVHDDVTKNFKSGILYQAEYCGILYFLDDNAKKAVENTKDFGLPYFVIVSETNFGKLYDVLYVSNDITTWEEDRGLDGYLFSNCYNSSMDFSELGSIKVAPANGGIVRVE